jgi:hydrogenase expression/formation protein HypE
MDKEHTPRSFSLSCPIPIQDYPVVLAAHGGGGRLMRDLIRRMFVSAFDDEALGDDHDGAILPQVDGRIAMTTDSYVVSPLFFPGGDIGSLAVHGTVNDLAMCGATPLYLSAGFILEEGLPMEDLWRVVVSMRDAAAAAQVRIVTGDTKVVERGSGDGVYINTAGVGVISHSLTVAPASIRPDDAVIVSGDIGRHGVAIMAVREGLAFESEVLSDSASVAHVASALIDAGLEVHCMRDLTRGGIGSALIEIAETAGRAIHIEEGDVPVDAQVEGCCELLGLDPLFVANEGRFVVVVPPDQAPAAVEVMQAHPVSSGARIIGSVTGLDMFSGEQLPRIC